MHMHNLLNEYTGLSQRLEHLVAHSSQMVFVSGEQMGNQKDFVEAFLSTRQDDIDVLYLTGNNFHGVQDVRNEFARQLLGQPPAVDLSLIQLVSARQQKRHPLLIAVTRAERLPDQILQELWDLVLQNRFARNQQKTNILLFGEQAWAEQTKAWLPTNNNDKPVLLTSETLAVQAEQEIEGDLESYIRAKREEFNERLKARALAHTPPQSVWANWWLRLLSVCVFIICFSGLLIWQYFDLTESAIAEFSEFLLQQQTTVETPASNAQQAAEAVADGSDIPSESRPNKGLAVQTETTSEQTLTGELPQDQARVTSWHEASKRLQRQPVAIDLPEEVAASPVKGTPPSVAQAADAPSDTGNSTRFYESESLVQIPTETLLQLQPPINTTPATVTAGDASPPTAAAKQAQRRPVPTSKSNSQTQPPTVIAAGYEQAAAMGPPTPAPTPVDLDPGRSVAAATTTAPAATAEPFTSLPTSLVATATDYPVADIVTIDEQPPTAEIAPAPAPVVPNYEYDEAELLNLPESRYLLQMSGISSRKILNEYILANGLRERVWIYKTRRYGGDWHVVLYNQSFTSLRQARDSVAELPRTSRQSAPFAKSIATIKAEIAQGYSNQ